MGRGRCGGHGCSVSGVPEFKSAVMSLPLHKERGKSAFSATAHQREGRRRPQSLDCVKFSLSKERDLFRLACNACWEILECVEWGTVVLLQLCDCIEAASILH